MSMFKGLFGGGGGGGAPARPSADQAHDRATAAMTKLKEHQVILEKKIMKMEREVREIEKDVLATGRKTNLAKQKAMKLMKQRKMKMSQIAVVQAQRDNIECQTWALDSSITTAATVDAMKTGMDAQKHVLDIEEAEKVVGDLQDTMQDVEELHDIMRETVGEDITDDDFESMMSELEADNEPELDVIDDLPVAPHKEPDQAGQIGDFDLPVAPTTAPAAAAPAAPVAQEAADLMAWMN
mmetsp:Transcript_23754/g.62083  ORF Transcript_23754/g.62083 Transcript_23754/m.62083 type:complete len:239 (+) Transcript_23754:104-820(+)